MLSLFAINEESYDLIQFLVKKGANLNNTDLDGNNALHYLAKYKISSEKMNELGQKSDLEKTKQNEIQRKIALLLLSFGIDFT